VITGRYLQSFYKSVIDLKKNCFVPGWGGGSPAISLTYASIKTLIAGVQAMYGRSLVKVYQSQKKSYFLFSYASI
jgi:hypothetical protein